MITPPTCRAARGLLDWSQAELAKRSNLGTSTIKDYEGLRRVPTTNNVAAIQRAFEAAGVEFIERGVRLKSGATSKD